ncbi:MAG: hypothetical protein D3923_04995 [Candidatus Electrothrix sp. AR3]|nr:hypothetical protein [Candidatus Electrothrix sp. AR3]
MNKCFFYGGLIVTSMILPHTAVFGAATVSTTKTDLAEEGWLSDGASLGVPWWTKNPKKFTTLPVPLLYHIEVNYSYSDSSGNVDIENHSGSAHLLLRKNTFSSETFFKHSKEETAVNLKPDASSILLEVKPWPRILA